MLLVNDNGTKILRKLVDGEFQWGDKVNLVGYYLEPGIVTQINGDSICVLWQPYSGEIYTGMAHKSWFESWELMHVV